MRHQSWTNLGELDLERCIFTSALEETWCPNLEAGFGEVFLVKNDG